MWSHDGCEGKVERGGGRFGPQWLCWDGLGEGNGKAVDGGYDDDGNDNGKNGGGHVGGRAQQ